MAWAARRADRAQFAVELEDGGHVRVPVQAQGPLRAYEATAGVEVVENIGVLVERRAVADLDHVVDQRRSGAHGGDPVAIFSRELGGGPADCVAGEVVETLDGFDPGPNLVVVSTDDRRIRQ